MLTEPDHRLVPLRASAFIPQAAGRFLQDVEGLLAGLGQQRVARFEVRVGKNDAEHRADEAREAERIGAKHPGAREARAEDGEENRRIEDRPDEAELRLRDGETVVPHEFLKKLSQQNHQGVFAVKETNGRLSLVAVAWDAVATATLRGLSELPKGLAD